MGTGRIVDGFGGTFGYGVVMTMQQPSCCLVDLTRVLVVFLKTFQSIVSMCVCIGWIVC